MEEPRVRIRDIAESLGLSTATVSYVLNGRTEKVSQRTAERVREALEEQGYLPRAAEVLLGQNPGRIVGVVMNDHAKYEGRVWEDAFLSSALNALSVETGRRGLQLMVKAVRTEEEILSFATMWNLEGLILIGFCAADYGSLRRQMRIPFVVYDGCGVTAERTCCINIDDKQGGFLVGDYFRSCGHQRVLCVSDNEEDMDLARWEGFRTGFGAQSAAFLRIPLVKEERQAFYQSHREQLCSFTGIFAVSDFYAVELIQFLQGEGIRIPEEISVAGFDDTPLAGMVFPTLTTVRQDTMRRAVAALDALHSLREGKETPRAVLLPVELVVRGSTRTL